jgi:tetratricopeptide (TPR) repeat protein
MRIASACPTQESMRHRHAMTGLILLWLSLNATAQVGVRGQVYLPNGSPVQRQIRFMLTTDNGIRHEYYFTDSNGRIAMPRVTTPYTITVESDNEVYDTTSASFDPLVAGNYIILNLRPLSPKATSPPGIITIDDVDKNVSPKARAAYEEAAKLLEGKEYKKAIESLKQAVSIQPNYFHAYNDLGAAYLKLNQLDYAAAALQQAIKINDKIYLPYLNLGIVYNRQAKHKEAAEVLQKIQKREPDRATINAPLIEALMGAQLWPQSEEAIKKALSLHDADIVDLKIKMGAVLIRQNKFAEAVAVLREAVRAEPDSPLANFNLGAALLQTGDLDEAEKSLRRAYEIRGAQMAGAQLQLGMVYHQKKNYAKAIEAFETYLRDLPNAPNAAQVKGAIQKLKQAVSKQ